MEENKNLWVLVLAVVALLLLFGSFGMGGYGMMGFGTGFGFLFMLLFWGFIIWIVVTLIKASQSSKNDSSDSLTILKKRYAKGEMTKKQFEEMKKEISKE
ncbi:MAG: SHOCT domain-containing protein [Nanoarchaeota archaeon]